MNLQSIRLRGASFTALWWVLAEGRADGWALGAIAVGAGDMDQLVGIAPRPGQHLSARPVSLHDVLCLELPARRRAGGGHGPARSPRPAAGAAGIADYAAAGRPAHPAVECLAERPARSASNWQGKRCTSM